MTILRTRSGIRSHVGGIIFNFPKLTLVLGGASSGKSRFAEGLITPHDVPRTYVATAQAFDDEMRAKIAQHQQDRGSGWTTVEAPLDLPGALRAVPEGGIVLVDCLTLWLTNLLLENDGTEGAAEAFLAAAYECRSPIVTVSNEVGLGIVPDNRLSRRFRAAQGRLNQAVAAQADRVAFVAAGLPVVLKGQFP